MKPSVLYYTFAASLLCTVNLVADDAAALCGKWSVKKVNDEGQKPALDVYQRLKAPEMLTLVVDEIEMADTPQSATWFVCFEVKTPDGTRHRYHVAGKEFDKKQVTIPVALELPKVSAGQKCSFTLQLDDVDDDACGDAPDNRSAGEFIVSERGSQSYKPED